MKTNTLTPDIREEFKHYQEIFERLARDMEKIADAYLFNHGRLLDVKDRIEDKDAAAYSILSDVISNLASFHHTLRLLLPNRAATLKDMYAAFAHSAKWEMTEADCSSYLDREIEKAEKNIKAALRKALLKVLSDEPDDERDD